MKRAIGLMVVFVMAFALTLRKMPPRLLPDVGSLAYADNCSPKDNLDETAEKFIGRCCKGSIRSEFPSEYLSKTLGDIQSACKVGNRRDCEDGDDPSLESAKKARTAWKLLSRSEYRK